MSTLPESLTEKTGKAISQEQKFNQEQRLEGKSAAGSNQNKDAPLTNAGKRKQYTQSSRVPNTERYRSHRPQALIFSAGVGAGSAGSMGVSVGASVEVGSKMACIVIPRAPSSAGSKRTRSSLKSTRLPPIAGAQFSPKTPSSQQDIVSSSLKSSRRSHSETALSRMDKEPKSPATNDTDASLSVKNDIDPRLDRSSGAKSRMGFRNKRDN